VGFILGTGPGIQFRKESTEDDEKVKIIDSIQNKLIVKMGFKYYDEDKYLIHKCIKCSNKKDPSVLDVGCGTGHHSLLFEKYGAKVTAFDYDESAIEKAKENRIKNNSMSHFWLLMEDIRKNISLRNMILYLCGASQYLGLI
jgi:methylase of polypeptide subunit release factors